MNISLESIGHEYEYEWDGTRVKWYIHKRFGEWEVKFTKRGKGLVLECGDYWICWTRAFEPDWVSHITTKDWGKKTERDLVAGLTYFRALVSQLKTDGVLTLRSKR